MKSVRHVFSSVVMTAMAASLVACQAGPQFAPGNLAQNPTLLRRANAVAPSRNASKIDQAVARGLDYVPGEYIVKLRPGANAAALSQGNGFSAMNAQMEPVGSVQSGIMLVKAGGGAMSAASEGQTLASLKNNPAVLYAEPNWIVKLNVPQEPPTQAQPPSPQGAPNDPLFSQQWHHTNMQSVAGWNKHQGNDDFILSIVDTGVDTNHPDLAAKLLPGYNTVDNNDTMTDGNGHGTHCAGIAAGITNNGVGIAGVAPNVKILPIKVLSDSGSGSYASVAAGIIKAADMGAKVISMSLGGPRSSAVIDDAVKHAMSKGALLIAAMGNDGRGYNDDRAIKSYPAAMDGVMSVGATDSSDKVARFSQMGDWNDVTAPGVNIMSTFPTHSSGMPGTDYGAISGTSMATPAVAGLAALVWSQNPSMNALQVEEHIEATADDKGEEGYDIRYGHGRVNVAKALSTAPGAARLAPRPVAPVNAAAFNARSFR